MSKTKTLQPELQEIWDLNEKIKEWNRLYFELQEPIVDDAEYDRELERLERLEEQHPEIFDISGYESTTKEVGSDLDKNSTFEKVKHEHPVLSLAKSFSKADLIDFENSLKKTLGDKYPTKNVFRVEPKLDGSHIVLTYENGKLIKACSRGDGKIGEDITAHMKFVKGVPQTINFKGHIVVEGEILIPNSTFLKLNEDRLEDEKYANSRNLAAGVLKRKNSSEVKGQGLEAVLYDASTKDETFSTQTDLINWLDKQGFQVDKRFSKEFNSIEELFVYFEKMDKVKNDTKQCDLPLDGMVVKLNDISLHSLIGETGKHPKYHMAYKFPPVIKKTKVLRIVPTVGRTGKITYVAELEPVEVEGAMVRNVTLHNGEYITQKDIRVGDTIEIIRSGMVIPKVKSVVLEDRKGSEVPFAPLTTCPCCGSTLRKANSDDVDFFCMNDYCKAKVLNKMIHFVQRTAMNIDGISEKTLEKFYEANFLENIFDLYKIANHQEEILNGDFKFKQTSMNKLLTNLENSKNNSLERLLFALGIKTVGNRMAIKLAQRFKTLENIKNATPEELATVDDVGETTIKSIKAFFDNNPDIFKTLKVLGINTTYIDNAPKFDIDTNNQFYGKKFCLSGSFENYKKPQLAAKMVNEYGAIEVSGVSPQTDFLIYGEGSGEKLRKAEQYNVPKLTEEEIETFFSENQPTKAEEIISEPEDSEIK